MKPTYYTVIARPQFRNMQRQRLLKAALPPGRQNAVLCKLTPSKSKPLIGILRNLRDNLRIMRKDSKLAALFPGLRQGVLRATIMNPDRWWYLSELATHLGTSPSSLQRELSSLVGSGILQQRREGSRRYFRRRSGCPYFPSYNVSLKKPMELWLRFEAYCNLSEKKYSLHFFLVR